MNFNNPTLYGASFPQQEFAGQFPWQWASHQRLVQAYSPYGQLGQVGVAPYFQQNVLPQYQHNIPYGQLGQVGMAPYFQQNVLPQYQHNIPFFPKNMGYTWPVNAPAPINPMGFPQSGCCGVPYAQWQRPIPFDYSH
jgi:hypothetical protein